MFQIQSIKHNVSSFQQRHSQSASVLLPQSRHSGIIPQGNDLPHRAHVHGTRVGRWRGQGVVHQEVIRQAGRYLKIVETQGNLLVSTKILTCTTLRNRYNSCMPILHISLSLIWRSDMKIRNKKNLEIKSKQHHNTIRLQVYIEAYPS